MQFPFFGKKNHRFVYTLVISKNTVGACVWHIEGGSIRTDAVSDLVSWDEENEASLFDAADTAIASLTGYSADQVLLSLPDDWVQGQSIHPKKKPLLRSLTEKLELSSLGFVVSIEALIAYLKDSATTPLNTVCACVDPDAFIMAVIEQGQASQILRIGRSGSITDDFLEGCSRLKISNIPPSVVLVSLCEPESSLLAMKEEFESYQWDQQIFVQPPALTIQSPFFVMNAVTTSGGGEVAKALPELVQEESTQPAVATQFTPVPTHRTEEITKSDEDEELIVHHDVSEKKRKKPVLIAIGGVVGLLLILPIIILFVFPRLSRAEIVLKRAMVSTSSKITVVVDTLDRPASQSAHVKAVLLPVTVTTEKEGVTTGKKQAGDKAGGSVAIYNKTSSAKTFPSGTQLRAGKLLFATSEEVTVASASSTISETVHGKAVVKVVAAAVGEESNINKNVDMSVGTYDASAFIARTETQFAGGTSRTVSSVTAKDQDNLTAIVREEASKLAAAKMEELVSQEQGAVLLDTITLSSKKFSKAIDEEASSLSLSVSASMSALVYQKSDIFAVASEAIRLSLPPGVSVDPSALTISVMDTAKTGDKSATVTFAIDGKVNAPLDPSQFSSILAGKKIAEANELLASQKNIETYTISIRPAYLAPFVTTLPKDSSRIVIRVP